VLASGAPNFALFAGVPLGASETDAPALGSRFLLPFQRQHSLCASVREPISAPFLNAAPAQ
jgi:hypothetical protein